MSRPTGRPPTLARALAAWLDGGRLGGSLTGDLDEEYADYQLPARGRRAADAWYWRQVLGSLPRLLRRRLSPSHLSGDVRFALRVLRRRPGYTAATVLTLGLGLGVNATLFAVVHAVLVRPLPYAEVEQLVRPVPDELFFLDAREAQDLAARMTTFESFAAWGRTLFLFTNGGEAEEVRGARVSWNHFDMLGVEAAIGRTFVRDDAEGDDAIVLGHALWVRRFGADPAVVGRAIDLSGRSVRVVGVLAEDHVPIEYDWEAWRPIPLDPEAIAGSGLAANARLRDGVTLEQARDEFRRVIPEIWAEDGYVASDEDRAAIQIARLDVWLMGDARTPLTVLMVAVGLLFLLACVNVSSLMIAQGGRRADEFAVRAALGGSRGRVGRQVLIEAALLGGLGVAVALGLASVSLGTFTALLPVDLPRAGGIAIGPEVVAFTVLGALLAVLLTGTAPALRAAAGAPARLVSARSGARGRERTRARFVLVATEMAMAVVLVVGASLTLRSLAALRAVDLGFDPAGVVTVRPSPPSGVYPENEQLTDYYARLSERLEALPGVEAVGGIQFLPMTPGGWWSRYVPEGWSAGEEENHPSTAVRVVWGDYFEAMGIPLVAGRGFERTDETEDAERVVLLNEALARDAFPDGEAVGRSVVLSEVTFRVVGVVADVRQSDVREASHPELYLPFSANPWRRMHMVVRGEGESAGLAATVGEVVREVDPGVSMTEPRPMAAIVAGTLSDAELLTTLLTLFGLTALALGAVGVHGVTAQAVSEQRREIGIRLALGAAREEVTRGTVLRGLRPVVVGLIIGVGTALFAGRLIEGVLFGIPSSDPAAIAGASVVLVLVAVTALVVPAVHAGRTDPVRSLREE